MFGLNMTHAMEFRKGNAAGIVVAAALNITHHPLYYTSSMPLPGRAVNSRGRLWLKCLKTSSFLWLVTL